MNEALTKEQRLLKRSEFKETMGNGIKVVSRDLVAFALPRKSGESRLGLVVTKKYGCAVDRNLIKRRLRDVFRRSTPAKSAGLDLVFLVKVAARGREYGELQRSVESCVRRLSKRLSCD